MSNSDQGITQPRGWYNRNAFSEYPLARGQAAPNWALTDLVVTTNSRSLRISDLSVSADISSVVFMDEFGLFAAVTVPSGDGRIAEFTSERGQGMVVFGIPPRDTRYRSSGELHIHPSCIRPVYSQSRVVHRGGLVAPETPLRLVGSGDIQTEFGYIDEEKTLPAVFVSLRQDEIDGRSINDDYLGTCDRRPAVNNCVGAQAIRSISGVTGDCCNRVYIEFQGVSIRPLTNYCGVGLDIDYGLKDACPDRTLAKVVDLDPEKCERPEDYQGYAKAAEDAAKQEEAELLGTASMDPVTAASNLSPDDPVPLGPNSPAQDVYGDVPFFTDTNATTADATRFAPDDIPGNDDDAEGDIPTNIVDKP
jgi:hypothetical protein